MVVPCTEVVAWQVFKSGFAQQYSPQLGFAHATLSVICGREDFMVAEMGGFGCHGVNCFTG